MCIKYIYIYIYLSIYLSIYIYIYIYTHTYLVVPFCSLLVSNRVTISTAHRHIHEHLVLLRWRSLQIAGVPRFVQCPCEIIRTSRYWMQPPSGKVGWSSWLKSSVVGSISRGNSNTQKYLHEKRHLDLWRAFMTCRLLQGVTQIASTKCDHVKIQIVMPWIFTIFNPQAIQITSIIARRQLKPWEWWDPSHPKTSCFMFHMVVSWNGGTLNNHPF